MNIKYDIFISYRRKDTRGEVSGTHIARNIQQRLLLKGYSVFFDYSEIKAHKFEDTILPALINSKALLLVLSKDALVRCVNDEDWVRREISTAIKHGIEIIPINPDKIFKNWPDNLPDELKPITKEQISDIDTEGLFDESVDKLIKDRIAPFIESAKICDADFFNYNDLIGKGDARFNRQDFKIAKERYKEAEELAKKRAILSSKELIELQYKIALCAFNSFKDDADDDEGGDADEYFSITQKQFVDSLFYSGYIFEHCKTPNKEKAFEKYGKAAQDGSGRAQGRIEEEICQLLSEADKLCVAKEYQKAIKLYQKAYGFSDDGWYKKPIDKELSLKIAKKKKSFNEFVIKKDFSSAALEFREVLCLRIGNRFYNVGKSIFDNKEYTKAIESLVKASERGISKANYFLGLIFSNGLGVVANKEKGYECYLVAAKSGHILAQMEVAKYHQGNGHPDLAEAWWRLAAESGNAEAQYELAKLLYDPIKSDVQPLPLSIHNYVLESGEKTESMIIEAFEWYGKSAENGKPEAMLRYAIMCEYYDEVKDPQKALDWFRKVINLNFPEKNVARKEFINALVLEASHSIYYADALALYTEAAEMGDKKHYKEIASIYSLEVKGVKDAKNAIDWYLKAVAEGDNSAYVPLSKLYRESGRSDLEVDSLRKAYESGITSVKSDLVLTLNSDGDHFLADKYTNGVSRDFDEEILKLIDN